MRLENAFEVSASAEAAWDLLMDVPRVIPCMPGAELVEAVDESTWKARMRVKFGPISLAFLTDVHREDFDDSTKTVRLAANAREERGRGAARATIESSLATVDGNTRVETVTELTLTGPVAQYGRGMVQDVAAQLLTSFANCLEKQLAATPDEGQAAVAEQQRPVSGLSLGFRAFWNGLARFGRRLVGRG